MSHPLDSAYRKVRRASEHVKQVEAEVKAFFEAEPYIVYAKYSDNSRQHTIRVRVLADPPSHAALIAADALQNLRSALDHLVYQLAGLEPTTPRGERTQYPIYQSPERFDSMPFNYLEGVPEPYRTHIRAIQPYVPDFASLWTLLVLNDRDKHRVLESFVASAHQLTIRAEPQVAATFRRVIVNTNKLDLEDDAILGTFESDGEVPMKFQPTWTIGFGLREGPRIDPRQLHTLVHRISQILAHFRSAWD